MSIQLPGLPQGLTGAPLVTALNDRLRRISSALGETASATTTAAPILVGTHAQRLTSPVATDATIYIETDRSNVAYQARAKKWVYLSGTMAAAWAKLPGDLGANDTGFLFYDSIDSRHIWIWTGAAWDWGPGDRHSGEFGQFDADPGAGWHICNGDVNQTKYASNGTRVTNFTVPNQLGFYLKAAGAYTGAGAAAVAPVIGGSPASGVANISTSSVPVDNGAGTVVQSGAGTTVAAHTHDHAAPTVTDLGHSHGIGTLAVDNSGTPPTFVVLPYYRL